MKEGISAGQLGNFIIDTVVEHFGSEASDRVHSLIVELVEKLEKQPDVSGIDFAAFEPFSAEEN